MMATNAVGFGKPRELQRLEMEHEDTSNSLEEHRISFLGIPDHTWVFVL
jgi:hypothetical protein